MEEHKTHFDLFFSFLFYFFFFFFDAKTALVLRGQPWGCGCWGAVEGCTGSEQEEWRHAGTSVRQWNPWWVSTAALRPSPTASSCSARWGEATFHHFLDLLGSQLLLWKLSAAACAKAHILLERFETDIFIYSFALKKKKEKNIICKSILLSCSCLQRGSGTESVECLSDADSVRLNGSLSEAAVWILIPDHLQRLFIFYHYHHCFLLEFYESIKCVFAQCIQP